MATNQGHILVVDDNIVNRKLLARALELQGYTVTTAANGPQALALLRQSQTPPIDVVLLDILMPQIDGYQVLAQLKADQTLRDIPVIMISALDEIESVVRCIEMGAEDYLPKPYNPVLLRARIGASLEKKRLRDQEVEYLRNVAQVTAAASAVEAATFDPASLVAVAERGDALGQLARVFQRMAREVHAREQRLKQQLQQLRLDIEERQKAAAETLAVYLPMDRRQALAHGSTLPERARGAALFADISGFTPLTEALAQELGLQRGAEELTRQLNQVYGALIEEVHRYGGSVINFSGDAIMCWFAEDSGLRATACALAMQAAMTRFELLLTPAGTTIALGIKVAVAAGSLQRWLVGDPQIQQIEALAGQTLDELAIGEHLAQRGDVLVQSAIVEATGPGMTVAGWRADPDSGARFAVVTGLAETVPAAPWPELPADSLSEAQARPWLLPPVYERVRGGKSEFLSELRPAAALFLQFRGIDYDADEQAGARLDAFVRWVQAVLARYDGALLQLTIGDKGSYLYAAFGAPIAHEDDAARAVAAALDLQSPPGELRFIQAIQIGLAYGQMRVGAYGGAAHRTYGVLGDKVNLAARLMQAASGGILCDDAIEQAARGRLHFTPLPPLIVKGKAQPVAVYRPTATTLQSAVTSRIDRLEPAHQLTLKIASVIGPIVPIDLLRDIYPIEAEKPELDQHLQALEQHGLLVERSGDSERERTYAFSDSLTHELAYNLLLFAQRRQLHRAVAEWYERNHARDLAPLYPLLAHHWRRAEDPTRTIAYLERAGEQARQQGAYQEAARYFHESLALDARMSVLSADYDASAGQRSPTED